MPILCGPNCVLKTTWPFVWYHLTPHSFSSATDNGISHTLFSQIAPMQHCLHHRREPPLLYSPKQRGFWKATKIQTTNAIKKQKPITMINRRAVFSISASCDQQLQELREVKLMRDARTTLGRGHHECLDKNLTTFNFGHFDVLIQGHFYLFGTCILRI